MSENPFANMDGLTIGDLGSLRDEWMKQYGAASKEAPRKEKVFHGMAAMKNDEHSYCYLRWTRRSDGIIR